MAIIVDIDHEVGDLSEYTTTVTDSGDLSVSDAAALAGTVHGLDVLIDDNTLIFGSYTLGSPITPSYIRYRFYVDPNSITMADTNAFTLFNVRAGSNILSEVNLHYASSSYNLRATIVNDAGSVSMSVDAAISDEPHYVEVLLTRSTNADSNDARMDWWVDGNAQTALTGADSYTRFENIDIFRLGAVSGIDTGTRGTVYLDQLVARDDNTEIGEYEEEESNSASPSSSASGSPSSSASSSPSNTPSASPSNSPSEGTPSGSPSEGTPSGSPSESSTVSNSASPSNTPSGSASGSPSNTPSASASNTPSSSPSGSASNTPSASPSGSVSESPSLGAAGSICWGHDTGVTEDTVSNFQYNWFGTGTIENAGVADTERIALFSGEYMMSEIVDTGAVDVQLDYNHYAAGDTITLEYRTGATAAATTGAAWQSYVAPFASSGFVQIKISV